MNPKTAQQFQQIEQSAIPPLSKSRYADLACETLYLSKNIQGVRSESAAAARGTSIHALLKSYVDHLCRTKQRSDFAFLDHLAKDESEEVSEISKTIREMYVFDPDQVLGTEIYIALDDNFSPCAPENAAFQGTLDLVCLSSQTDAEIHDYKSYFGIVDADSFEAKMYCLLLMCSNPSIERVTFFLDFVRYGASRKVTYTRDELPALKERALRERNRQLALHQKDEEKFSATPGRHCSWCSKLQSGCPLAKVNPYAKLDPAQRLMTTVYLKHAYEQSLAIMKDLVIEQGPIQAVDDNGGLMRAAFKEKTVRSYPLLTAGDLIATWCSAHAEDHEFVGKLTVGGLSSPLKAKKRSALADAMVKVAQVKTQTDFKVGVAKEDEEQE